MLRATPVARKISVFAQYVREAHAASNRRTSMSTIASHYRKLTPAQRSALRKRADKAPNPWGKKYADFLAGHKNSFRSLKPVERQRKIAALWHKERLRLQRAERKAAGAAGAPQKRKAAAAKPKKAAASKKVKKAAKQAKAAKKTAKK